MQCKCYFSNEQKWFPESSFEMGSKTNVYVMSWSAKLLSFTAQTETMCVWVSLTHLRNIVQCLKKKKHCLLVSVTAHFFFFGNPISDLLFGWSRIELYKHSAEYLKYLMHFNHSHGWLCFNVFQQSNAWWKLKTIVHCPLVASQRRRLPWVQLAGHKGIRKKCCTF